MPCHRSPYVVLSGLICALIGAPLLAQGFPSVPVPPGNPITTDKVNLGKALFWDEQMSSTRTVACGTCHRPMTGGSDPRSGQAGSIHPGADNLFGTADDVIGSPGVVGNASSGSYGPVAPFGMSEQVTPRKAPSVINAVFSSDFLFWDGRATGTFVDPVSGVVILPSDAALERQAAEPPVSDEEMSYHDRDWPSVAAAIAVAT